MVTKKELLEAINTIQRYERQVSVIMRNVPGNLTNCGLERGDYIRYIGGSDSKWLQLLKKYKLTCAPYRNLVCIINDNGQRVCLKQDLFEKIN